MNTCRKFEALVPCQSVYVGCAAIYLLRCLAYTCRLSFSRVLTSIVVFTAAASQF